MKVEAIHTRIFLEKESIISFIEEHIQPKENMVIVVTSKILALSQGRVVEKIDDSTREKVIKEESDFALRTKWTWMTIKDNMLLSSAGIDESNADGKIILLPRDCFKEAEKIRTYFCEKYSIKNLGIVITDSRSILLRWGAVGMATGYAGFRGLKNYVGTPDIFGHKLKVSRVNVPDSLAAAAVLCMGEGNEQQPLAVISDIDLEWSEVVNESELEVEPHDDIFHPLFDNLPGLK